VGEWIAGVVRILLGLMLFAGLYEYAPRSWNGLAVLFALALLSFLVTFFHELGHALAVWRQRGTVLAISVCGLTYLPPQRRLTFEWLPRGGDLAGFVRLRQPEGGWTRGQHAVVLAAGPFADALVALLALGASVALSMPAAPPDGPVAAVAAYDPTRSAASQSADLPTRAAFERIRAGEPDFGMAPAASMLMVVAFISSLGNLLPYRGSDGAGLLAVWRGRSRFSRPGRGGR
jgi:hypothetical protein